VLTGEWPGIRSRPEVERAVSAAHFSVGKIRRGGIDDQLLSHRLTQLYTGSINTSGRTIAAPLSARAGGYGIGGVTEDHVDLVDRNAEHLRSRLGEDGVTARADVGHVRFDSDAAIALKAHASARGSELVASVGGRHALPDQPLFFAHLRGPGVSPRPSESLRARTQALHQRSLREGMPGT